MSVRPLAAMTINPFGMHYQSVWRERAATRAANPTMPLWIRVAALAYGCHRRNGHAAFKAGEIAEILGTPDEPLSASSVSNAIKLAKNAAWIAEASNARCLVVPTHAVQGGVGHPNDRCPIHGPPVQLHATHEETGVKVHVKHEVTSRHT